MRFGSVCSGIEAASAAWHPLGWEAAWFSEIEPFPCAVLAHHYPEVPNHGDMTALPQLIRSGEVEAPDLFCGGTPCQAFSVAGLRRSLDDARGNLSLTFCEIANAIDAVRLARGELPAVVFWENVPGVLSTADNAFGCFLAGLAGDDQPAVAPRGKWKAAGVVVGPERLAAWRVLDAQFFGVAQRRRRVFVVSVSLRHPRAWAIAESILPVVEGLRRDSAPSREAGQGAAVCPTLRAGGNSTGGDRPPGTDVDTADSLQVVQPYPVGNTLTARMHKGINTTLDEGQTPVLAHTLGTQCSWATEDGTGRGSPLVPVQPYTLAIRGRGDSHNLEYRQDGTANALLTPNGGRGGIGVGAIAHAFDARQSDVIQYGDKTGPLDTDGHSIGVAIGTDCYNGAITGEVAATLGTPGSSVNASGPTVMQPVGVFQDSEFGVQQYDSAGTLRAGRIPEHQMVMQPVPMINMQGSKGNAVAQADGPSFTLNAMHGHDVHAVAVAMTAMRESGQGYWMQDDIAGTIDANMGMSGHANRPAVIKQPAMQVRRLTPVECERLQGFPDNYTAIPWRNKPASECPDGPRYKALGNSWAVPVVRWIGERISAVTAARKSAPPIRGSRC